MGMTNNMRNLKSLVLVAIVAVGSLALAANAAEPKPRVVPRNQIGAGADPLYGGFLHMRNSGTDEMVVCSGRCLLAAIIMGTGPNTTKLTVRNSSVADGSGATVLYSKFLQSNSQAAVVPLPPLPILLDKGITATISGVNSAEEVTVLYIDMD
jgi:hypothetical protein